MTDRRRLIFWGLGAAGAAVLALGLWFGFRGLQPAPPAEGVAVKAQGATALDAAQAPGDVQTVDVTPGADIVQGTTPMAERVAVLGLLNKRNGIARDVTLKPGQAVRVGDVVVRLRACEQTAPWEADHYTGAFVQLDVLQPDRHWSRVFSGWLYKERPSLNVVPHPIYDVWPKSCAMRFPATGPDTVVASAPQPRSSASNAADAADEGDAGDDAPVESAPSTAPDTAAPNSPR